MALKEVTYEGEGPYRLTIDTTLTNGQSAEVEEDVAAWLVKKEKFRYTSDKKGKPKEEPKLEPPKEEAPKEEPKADTAAWKE